MILLHTSDWHLGHTLHGHDRHHEHEAFLAWLLDKVGETAADALLIAGDIFDTAHPTATAQRQWYRFLATLRGRYPQLDVVVIGGNHDSAARLDAPLPVLEAIDVTLVGGLRQQGRKREASELVVPLHTADGAVGAWVAAVPYLRLPDLPRVAVDDGVDPVIEGVRVAYEQVLDSARAQMSPGQALIAMGHCYMSGTELSEKSERRILVGNQHALPASLFPEDVAYVALGHLHKPQRVGSERVRYSGSPIPLSMSERHYPHQILEVHLDGDTLGEVLTHRVPRTVDILRVPSTGASSTKEVLAALAELPEASGERDTWPFLEVHVALDSPKPSLRKTVEDALDGKGVRLVRLNTVLSGQSGALGEVSDATGLGELRPDQVFELAWKRRYSTPPDDAVRARFAQLEEAASEVSA